MNILERKIESQVQFWSILGPSIILLSLTVLMIKVSSHWYLPVSALVGIPICLRWKMKGLVASLTLLFMFVLFSYPGWEIDEKIWHVGMGIAMACSFVILALSLEEVEGLMSNLRTESQSRLDNFLRLDEATKAAERAWLLEKKHLDSQVQILAGEIAQSQTEKQTLQKLTQLAKEELILLRNQYEHLIEDLAQKKQQITQLKERVEETEMTLQSLVDKETEQQLQHLTNQLMKSENEVHQLKIQQEKNGELLKRIESEKNEIFQEWQKILDQKAQYEHELANWGTLIQKKSDHIETLEQEKNWFQTSMAALQTKCDQFCDLEKQYQQELSQQLSTARHLQELMIHKEKDLILIQEQKKQLESSLNQQEEISKQRQEELNAQLKEAIEQMAQLKELLRHKEKELLLTKEQQRLLESSLLQQEKAFNEQCEELKMQLNESIKQLAHLEKEKDKQLEECQRQMQLHLEEQLNRASKQYQEQLEINSHKYQTLEQAKLQVEQELADIKSQLDSYSKYAVKPQEEFESSVASGNTRRVEAMYVQLKEQFQEKSSILDATRRELFHTQECLLSLQKEIEEKNFFAPDDYELLLQKDFDRSVKECELIQQQQQEELNTLYELVGELLEQAAAC